LVPRSPALACGHSRLEPVVRGLAVGEGKEDARVPDGICAVEEVEVEDDEAGEPAGVERSRLLLDEVDVRPRTPRLAASDVCLTSGFWSATPQGAR